MSSPTTSRSTRDVVTTSRNKKANVTTDWNIRDPIQSYKYLLSADHSDNIEYIVLDPEWYAIVVWAMEWYDQNTVRTPR